MASTHLPVGVREVKRRQQALRRHLGAHIHDLRVEAGISRQALAAAVGVDSSHLSRVERGLAQPSLDLLVAIGVALGADLGVRLFPGAGPRIKDRFQAPIVEALIRGLHPRWIAFPEIAVPAARGFIDAALGLRDGSIGVACEVQSELRAIDVILRRGREKAGALANLGIVGPRVDSLLLIRSTNETREIVQRYSATLAAAFPAPTAATMAALRNGDAPWFGPAIVWARLEAGHVEILEGPPRGIMLGR